MLAYCFMLNCEYHLWSKLAKSSTLPVAMRQIVIQFHFISTHVFVLNVLLHCILQRKNILCTFPQTDCCASCEFVSVAAEEDISSLGTLKKQKSKLLHSNRSIH